MQFRILLTKLYWDAYDKIAAINIEREIEHIYKKKSLARESCISFSFFATVLRLRSLFYQQRITHFLTTEAEQSYGINQMGAEKRNVQMMCY